MIVILCHADDAAALWLCAALRRLGRDDVEAVSVEALVYSRRIVHRLDDAGDTGEIEMADGRVLRCEAIDGIVNRVRFLPLAHIERAAAADRTYATEEIHAFLLAWLDGVAGRVINPPLPTVLDGGTFPTATVVHLAAMAGLPTRRWAYGSEEDPDAPAVPGATVPVIAFDNRIFGPVVPRALQDGCRRLAVLLGVPLLEVALSHSAEGGWRFQGARGLADFRAGGAPLAAAISRTLTRRAAEA
jgi:hypothetical protein